MIRAINRGLFLLALSLALAGCSTDFPEVTPTPTPDPITEPPFTGTLSVNGAVTQPFLVTSSGPVTITVMMLEDSAGQVPIGPDGHVRIGLALGVWNGTACAISVPTLYNDNAFVATELAGLATGIGPLCVRVSDVGKLTEPVSFELRIQHF
jgi:hypothetical protein